MTVPQAADTARRLNLSPHATFVIVVVTLLAIVSALTYATHEVYEGVTAGNGVEGLDHPALQMAVAARGTGLTAVAVTFTELAGRVGDPVLGLIALGVLTWRRRDWTPTVLLVTGLLGSLAITVAGKNLSGRVRPPREFALPPFETSPSFPSGHSLNAAGLATLVCYLVLITVAARWARWVMLIACVAFPVVVGLSRVYLGQHWLTDVLAGLAIGLGWGLSVVLAHRIWLELRGHRHPLEKSPGRALVADTPDAG